MLQHLNELMEDCSDDGFVAVRNYHAVVLSEMEQNRLTWLDTEKIQRPGCQYAQNTYPRQQRLRVMQARPRQSYVSHVMLALVMRLMTVRVKGTTTVASKGSAKKRHADNIQKMEPFTFIRVGRPFK